jgi:hypothetical protein
MYNITIKTIIILLSSSFVFAANNGQAYQEQLLVTLFTFVQYFAIVIGLGFMIKALLLIRAKSGNPNDQTKLSTLLFWILSASILMSLNGWIGMTTATLFGENTYCLALAPDLSDSVSGQCFDANTSTATQEIQQRVNNQITQDAQFLNYVNLAFGVIQLLGLIYFISAVMSIRKIGAGGQDGVTPAKPIIGMFFSALLIDLPHTLEVLTNTIKLMGFQI